jgi:O-antigen biosynthesis protein WbqP
VADLGWCISGWREMKRAFDFLVSALGLIVLMPVMLAIAYFVSRSSPGGVLFAQSRVGKSEKLFRCYKFRTMTQGAPVAGSHEVAESWITPTGRRLRSAKLDELPQLFNVLRGDMSLVGPRPCLPNQIEVIAARRARNVFRIRPGITGPAQLASIDMSTPEKLAQADSRYIDSRSFIGDLRIIAATVLGGGSGDAAIR